MDTDKPQISIIMPIYNAQNTIQQAVESALNQNFTKIEVLVINDGSTDSSLTILQKIQDQRLKIYSYPNSGSLSSP